MKSLTDERIVNLIEHVFLNISLSSDYATYFYTIFMAKNDFSMIVVQWAKSLLTSKEAKLMDKQYVFQFQPTSQKDLGFLSKMKILHYYISMI